MPYFFACLVISIRETGKVGHYFEDATAVDTETILGVIV
jgi:hypothetical protein